MASCSRRRNRFWAVGLLLGSIFAGDAVGAGHRQFSGVIHLHTTVSSGRLSLTALVDRARETGIDVLIPTDHDLVVMEYGLPPLRHLLKRREERPSILSHGPERYLSAIAELNAAQSDVLIIPGAQSSPFYFWSGSPVSGTLTAHNCRKELLLVGLRRPDDYRRLPSLHNSGVSPDSPKRSLRWIPFTAALAIGVALVFQRGRFRLAGVVVGTVATLLLLNYYPFAASGHDPYNGDPGIGPYQETIDYVRSRNGLVFWAHPESNYAAKGQALGPIRMQTDHYADDLLTSRNYTGFAAVYGDSSRAIEPGRQWDRALIDYCRERRSAPVWGIAGADFHGTSDREAIDAFQTIFLAETKSESAILKALAKGRYYAVRKHAGTPRLSLDLFYITSTGNSGRGTLGETVAVDGLPRIRFRVSAADGGHYPVDVRLIRGGTVVAAVSAETPVDYDATDPEAGSRSTYYRLDARGRRIGMLVTNPVFVRMASDSGPKPAAGEIARTRG